MVSVRGNGSLIICDQATYGKYTKWYTNMTQKISSYGITSHINCIYEYNYDKFDEESVVYDYSKVTNTLFAVLPDNLEALVTTTALIQYIEQYRSMAVLVIPKCNSGLATNIDKDVNRMRDYLTDQALSYGALVFDSVSKAQIAYYELINSWSNTVATFGLCGNTTWRNDIINPFLERSKVKHYNPQQEPGVWNQNMIAKEEVAKLNSNILVLNLNLAQGDFNSTGLTTQIEAVRFGLMTNRNVIIMYDDKLEFATKELITNSALLASFNISRNVMIKMINESKNPYLHIVTNFQDAIMMLNSIIEKQRSMDN